MAARLEYSSGQPRFENMEMGQGTLPARTRGLGGWFLPGVLLSFCLLSLGSAAAPQNSDLPEVQAHEGKSDDAKPFQIHVERNLVTVKVVVRDSKGRPVSHLGQEEFRLFDEGMPQEILGFTEETNLANAPEIAPSATPAPTGSTVTVPPAPAKAFAQRFVILYFDDFHLATEGIDRTRTAAWRYVLTAVQPQDRVAIFTSTGKDQLDFTDDRQKLHDALFKVLAKPQSARGSCPEISDYEAYEVTQQVPDALAVLHEEAIQCDCDTTDPNVDPSQERSALSFPVATSSCNVIAKQRVENEAAQIWDSAKLMSKYSLGGIEGSVRRLAAMPGQRTLVLVSPGFLTQTAGDKIEDIIDRALRQDVVVSAIDSMGLAAPMPHEHAGGRGDLAAHQKMIESRATIFSEDVLNSLSAATGGIFFHDNNDFGAGFAQAAEVPEAYYVLTFSPPDLKLNGKFHSLKVTLNSHDGFTVQARRGYFASKDAMSMNVSTQDALEKVVFSQEEIHGLSAEVNTQIKAARHGSPMLAVVIHVDVHQLQFRKEADRSVDKLTFHTTLFDDDGKYIADKEASLDLHLKDATLQRLMQFGLNAVTSFPVPAGVCRVREIVWDTESKGIAALNCIAQMPGEPTSNGAQ